MPIYEYKCQACGYEYEIIQKISDSPIPECEQCHKLTASRLVSAPGFQLKGTGWYETDFKNKGKPVAEVKSDTTTAGASEAKSSKTSEDK
ncbi:MAG: hypothetical protein A3E88_01380 [Legionellales bacterium RIFCSPHIGHO2_12_FULL_35_11]|nr:MAG: hypothetical protein A3E88_01380 [Legionellales bacterium RIFCSPHIGHO2_12_FULL_35_11]